MHNRLRQRQPRLRQSDHGHGLHMRAINQVRAAGSIQAAVERGLIRGGIMHALVTRKVPFVLAGDGAVINEDEWNSRPGGIRRYSGTKPEMIPGTGAPSSTIAQAQMIIARMQDIAGIHDVSQGKNPAGVRAGKAISALQGQDSQRLDSVMERRDRGWARVGRMILQTVRQFANEARIIGICGADRSWKSITFDGDMLEGARRETGVDYFNVRVTASGMGRSRSAQLDVLQTLLQYGVLQPQTVQDDREQILRTVRFGRTQENADPREEARNVQVDELMKMQFGQVVHPLIGDVHEEHKKEIERFEQTARFRELPPEIQALIHSHWVEHAEMQGQKAAETKLLIERGAMSAMQRLAPQGLPTVPGAAPQTVQAGPPMQVGNGRMMQPPGQNGLAF